MEKLFLEDRITALALLPLYLRMACTHVVLLYGTNNIDLAGLELSTEELQQRTIASKVVLAGRIFHAATFVNPKNFLHFMLLVEFCSGS